MFKYPLWNVRILAFLTIGAASMFAQIPGNIMGRTFEVRVPGGATARTFFVDVDGQEYLFTANHVVEALGEQAKVELFNDAQWHPLNVRILHGETKCQDVAVMIPAQKERIVTADPLPQLSNFFMGQEVYFLGFPYGLAMQVGSMHWTAPLVKHGYTSAVVRCSDLEPGIASDKSVLLLGGFNNPGFSGGPVVARDLNDPNRPLKLVALISAYRYERAPLSVNGQNAVNASVPMNTGIIVAIPFDSALELIKSDKAHGEKPRE
jgi:S1-C subfamily serine protease